MSQVAPIDKLSMPLGILLAVIILHERPTMVNWAGILLIAGGAYLATWPRPKAGNRFPVLPAAEVSTAPTSTAPSNSNAQMTEPHTDATQMKGCPFTAEPPRMMRKIGSQPCVSLCSSFGNWSFIRFSGFGLWICPMRLFLTADLHYNHPKSRPLADELIDRMNASGGDVLIVIGDTAVFDGTALEECLSRFRFDGPRLFVAGNHELWTNSSDSYGVFTEDLPRRVRALGWRWLESEPFVAGDIAIVGTVGWYDYSFASSELGIRAVLCRQGFTRSRRAVAFDGSCPKPPLTSPRTPAMSSHGGTMGNS